MKTDVRGLIVNTEDLNQRWIERAKRLKLNEFGIHPGGGHMADKLLDDAIAVHALKDTKKAIAELENSGIMVEYDAHVLSWLLPRKMHQMYPDWFRMDENGERKPDYNMCASNPDALDYVADRSEILARLMKTNSHRYAYWIDDVKGYKCNCSACRALSAADQALRIMNAMLRGIKRADPEAMLPYLAYHDTIIVPEKTQPLQGIYLEYAPINRDIHMAINDETSDKNRAESAYIRELIAFFGKKNSRVLEYWVDNSLFSNWTRPPKKMYFDSETMKKDVDFYHEVGFSQMTSFACFLGEDYIDLYGEPDMDAYGRILLGE